MSTDRVDEALMNLYGLIILLLSTPSQNET